MPDKHHANGVRARNIVSKRHVSMPLKGHMGEDLHIDVEMTGGDPLLHKKAAPPGGTMSSFRLIRFLFYGITVCLAFLLILVTLNNTWPLKSAGHTTNSLDHVSVALGVQERTHAVVLDAGSTGSRVLAFTFFKSRSG
ncbi:hypothetical protein E2C01_010789 [Portunus trituberculatus]|uniref:Ectonucleoside triphosphate diphosphohydrolase 5 n=3 Tax=Portunus trituberculatus TaxID=210409 RepID=A0A5B7D9C9_PORTR|nr:hypothetical protein [Portunus trituberculatus]